jgi:tetratricopeptide (TPR) repeat protein
MRLGQYQNAITDLWAAIRHDTGNANYYSQLARCNQELGQITDALSNYAEAIRNSMNNPEITTIYLERGSLYSKQGKYEKAITDFETAINKKIGIPQSLKI